MGQGQEFSKVRAGLVLSKDKARRNHNTISRTYMENR